MTDIPRGLRSRDRVEVWRDLVNLGHGPAVCDRVTLNPLRQEAADILLAEIRYAHEALCGTRLMYELGCKCGRCAATANVRRPG